jgi:hypothetical protein
MEKVVKESFKPKNNAQKGSSIKKILFTALTVILSITSILFGYLYFSTKSNISEDISDDSVEEKNNDETMSETQEETTTCDFDKIRSERISTESDRFHIVYEFILGTLPSPLESYSSCKDTLTSIIKTVVENQDILASEDIETITANIDNNNFKYLIDHDFIVYGFTGGKIWNVNIIDESVDLLLEIDASGPISIGPAYVINQDDTSYLFFSTASAGLGGTAEETDTLNDIRKNMCDNGDLGIWMYDSSNKDLTKIKNSKDCV